MSLDTGLTKGMQYMADYMHCVVAAAGAAAKHPDQAGHLLRALAQPATDWLAEAKSVGGLATDGTVQSKILLVLIIKDPFEGSRHDVQKLKSELGVK